MVNIVPKFIAMASSGQGCTSALYQKLLQDMQRVPGHEVCKFWIISQESDPVAIVRRLRDLSSESFLLEHGEQLAGTGCTAQTGFDLVYDEYLREFVERHEGKKIRVYLDAPDLYELEMRTVGQTWKKGYSPIVRFHDYLLQRLFENGTLELVGVTFRYSGIM